MRHPLCSQTGFQLYERQHQGQTESSVVAGETCEGTLDLPAQILLSQRRKRRRQPPVQGAAGGGGRRQGHPPSHRFPVMTRGMGRAGPPETQMEETVVKRLVFPLPPKVPKLPFVRF